MKCYDYERCEYVAPSNVIKRDFLRALVTEYYKQPCKIFTVNKLEDRIKAPSIISKQELNCNVNRWKFIQHIQSPECNWKIDIIFFDHFRMFPAYVAENFGMGFFERLKDMAKANILSDYRNDGRGYGTIYLPFNYHFFIMSMHVECQNYSK